MYRFASDGTELDWARNGPSLRNVIPRNMEVVDRWKILSLLRIREALVPSPRNIRTVAHLEDLHRSNCIDYWSTRAEHSLCCFNLFPTRPQQV